ncbi:tyrosine-protein phosphatase [Pseudomonas chlororaphis]|uniref:tyrosine-protein phosphatase n=1 Tax=Pseudomonas chlororaphis TaxID=587753 RepID=UPI00209AC745|nr:tyrosine-protein phosphatase [Pseudomonas chlororaphis]MCO7572926.1 tyrosine-protein phosphatase [Pseudomonas chlororaphis]MCO7591002.1 tyrosine-protein phosphatase [Pseudomonas chlororaphis]MCO7614037.1 tyrosine-protein phosphatase [Pseudomonas chlororaphis]
MSRFDLALGATLLCTLAAANAAPAEQPALLQEPPTTERQALRALDLASAPNLRDLGGYRTADGRSVKWGLLYRGGALDKLSAEDQRSLQRLQLQRVVDLRSRQEIADAPDRLPPELMERRIEMPITAGNLDIRELTRRIHSGDTANLQLDDMLVSVNTQFVREQSPIFRTWLHGLLDDQGTPILYHCTAGKDRTGFASAIVLLALGVPEATVMADYLESNRYLAQKNQRIAQQVRLSSKGRADPAVLQPLLGVEPRYLQAAFTAMRDQYGSVENYLRDGLGVDEQFRERLQGKFLEAAAP